MRGLLDGKRALVTGGAVNIGRAIALSLAKAGADVAVLFRGSGDAAGETLGLIEAEGCRGLLLRADITREEEVKNAFALLADAWGGWIFW